MTALNEESHNLTTIETCVVLALPLVSFIVIFVALRVAYPSKVKIEGHRSPNYGAIRRLEDGDDEDDIYAGQNASFDSTPWFKTFEIAFVLGLLVFVVALSYYTNTTQPSLWLNTWFWIAQGSNILGFVATATIAGLISRAFGVVDSKGYIMTSISQTFKFNYTRKSVIFVAYLLPLIHHPWQSPLNGTTLALAWLFLTNLFCIALLVKPIRENIKWSMIQFNSIDLPKDRPHTLKWLVLCNLAPGFSFLVMFNALFSELHERFLLLIFLTATVGNAFAEPVGSICGQHKYKVISCRQRRHTRSIEGSACVFISTMLILSFFSNAFNNFQQIVTALVIVPTLATGVEAIAPRTFGTSSLILINGLSLFIIVSYL